ncbi:MAG: ATP-dependent DNA ligase [Candidatus Jordarchaeum sp.]|uniref:ATP-dependent DNA ligase n=1 Tax=Candidatus Jordarchaeum sp. TaxID=2823881 RepID=UPI00404B06E5
MSETFYKDLAELCEEIESTTKRLVIIELIAQFLNKIFPEEVAPSIRMIVGKTFPEWSPQTLDLSWRTTIKVIKNITKASDQQMLQAFSEKGDLGDMAQLLMLKKDLSKQTTLLSKPLTILEVYNSYQSISEIKGGGSKKKKENILLSLLSRASPLETKYIIKNLIGEMRHGASSGLMEEAIAKATGVPLETVKRAHMLIGDLGEVAEKAFLNGSQSLKEVRPIPFRPIRPMLAQSVENVAEALKEHGGETSLEYKLDGARLQIHILNGEIRIFSRKLTEVTMSLPEIVEKISNNIQCENAIIEGEVIAISNDARPLPFQNLMRRFRRIKRIKEMVNEIPVKLYLFDIIYLDGNLLIDQPYRERRKILSNISGKIELVPQLVTGDQNKAQEFFKDARGKGHEGLIAKKIESKYTPGRRGKKWLKIKETETLDLVIVGADWGYGRRVKWLSDYYLAARNGESGELQTIGKTFKGLTDEEFEDITKKLEKIKTFEDGRTVKVKPEIVVETIFDEIQKSPKYESGYALRFARIKRIRDDKDMENIDTIKKVKQLYENQFKTKAKSI